MISLDRSHFPDQETWIWSSLLAAPLLMFANLGVTYALTPLLCSVGGTLALHLMCASCALPTIVMTVGTVRTWQEREDRANADARDGAAGEETVLPELASIVAALATLVVLAQWLAIWILPPCL